jgi:hypothetical protein
MPRKKKKVGVRVGKPVISKPVKTRSGFKTKPVAIILVAKKKKKKKKRTKLARR